MPMPLRRGSRGAWIRAIMRAGVGQRRTAHRSSLLADHNPKVLSPVLERIAGGGQCWVSARSQGGGQDGLAMEGPSGCDDCLALTVGVGDGAGVGLWWGARTAAVGVSHFWEISMFRLLLSVKLADLVS